MKTRVFWSPPSSKASPHEGSRLNKLSWLRNSVRGLQLGETGPSSVIKESSRCACCTCYYRTFYIYEKGSVYSQAAAEVPAYEIDSCMDSNMPSSWPMQALRLCSRVFLGLVTCRVALHTHTPGKAKEI